MFGPKISYERVPVDDAAGTCESLPVVSPASQSTVSINQGSLLICLSLICGTVIGLLAAVLLFNPWLFPSSFTPVFHTTASDTIDPALPFAIPFVGPISPLDCYGTLHVDWSDVCNSSYWEAIINVVLASHKQHDHSTSSNPQSHDGGTRRLYRTILKLLCGHPVIVGTTGTSVGCGQGLSPEHRNDPHLFSRMIYHYLSKLRPLASTNHTVAAVELSLGYWNGCMGGSGSDTASICLGTIFDSRFLHAAVQQQARAVADINSSFSLLTSSIFPPGVDPRPELRHPQYLTSVQYAERYKLSSVIPDLLLVEYVANDARAVASRTFGSPNVTDSEAKQVKIDNMDRLLHQIWQYPTAAPLLINTVVAYDRLGYLIDNEQLYSVAQARHNIPSLSLRTHLGLNSTVADDKHSSPAEFATYQSWRDELLVRDGIHPNSFGHMTVALMFTHYFNRLIEDLSDTIQYLSSISFRVRSAGADLTQPLQQCSSALLNSTNSDWFESSATLRVWNHPVSEDTVCAMRWSLSLNQELLLDNGTVSSHLFQFRNESDLNNNKWAWSTVWSSAWLRIRLSAVSRSRMVTGFSFAFLCSDWVNMSTSALVWIEGTQPATGTQVNVSAVHTVNSWWRWRQSTIITKEIPFSISQDEIKQLTDPVVHFVNLEDKKFSLAGIFVRTESSSAGLQDRAKR